MSAVDVEQLQPISRTYQYRKVMKPMLERKRRARINRCLDELKEFILSTLQAEGENVSKLEKADILEFTVQHLHKLRRRNRPNGSNFVDVDRFRAGFTHCASEVSRCLASTPGVDVNLGTKLMTHLGHRLNEMEKTSPLSVRVIDNYSPAPSSPSSISSSESSSSSSSSSLSSYNMPLTPNSAISSTTTFSRDILPFRHTDSPPTSLPASAVPTNASSERFSRSLSTKPSLIDVVHFTPDKFDSSVVWRPW